MKSLTRETVEQAFMIAGQYLRDRKVLGEISVYGGSAIMMQFDWRKTTEDVDAVITSDNVHGDVQSALDEAAKRLSLPRSWLNESVSIYRLESEGEGDTLPIGMYPSYENPGLRVVAATPEYLFVLKIMAFERAAENDKDFEDAANLGAELYIESIEQIEHMLDIYSGNIPLKKKISARIPELCSAIQDRIQTGPKFG